MLENSKRFMTAMMLLGFVVTSGCSTTQTTPMTVEYGTENNEVRHSMRESADGEGTRITIFEDGVEREISGEELGDKLGDLLQESEIWQSQQEAGDGELTGEEL